MKKKILSLLLILVLLPLGFLFVGCNEKVYSLTNLATDYGTLTNGCTSFKMDDDGKIIVDYSVYKDSEQTTYLKHFVETENPYKQLNDFYFKTFDNSMLFAYAYLKDCAKDNLGVTDALATEIETKLADLKTAIKDVDSATTLLADVVKFAIISTDEFDNSCMYELRNVFEKYEKLLEKSLSFGNSLAKVYFDHAMPGSNVDYSVYHTDGPEDEFYFKKETTISLAIGYLTPKAKFQIINLTQCLLELEIKAKDLPNKFTTAPYPSAGTFFETYKAKVDAINQELDTSKAKTIADDVLGGYAEILLGNLVRLYNVQNTISNDKELYATAFASIEYAKVKKDFNNATITQKMCVDIIDNYNATINNYQEILSTIITFIVEL